MDRHSSAGGWFDVVRNICACSRQPDNNASQTKSTQGIESGSDKMIEDETTTEIESQSQVETEAVLNVVTGLTTYYIRGGDGSTSDTISTLIRAEVDYKEYCEKEKRFVLLGYYRALFGSSDAIL